MGRGRLPASTGNRGRDSRKASREAVVATKPIRDAHARRMVQAEAWAKSMRESRLRSATPFEAARLYGFDRQDEFKAFAAGSRAAWSKRWDDSGRADISKFGLEGFERWYTAEHGPRLAAAAGAGWAWSAAYR